MASKFKVGDRVRRTRDPARMIPVGTVCVVSSTLRDPSINVEGRVELFSSDCFELDVSPMTTAERRKEQNDLIAEKEALIAECNTSIAAARVLLKELESTPPEVGETWKTASGSPFTILAIDSPYAWIKVGDSNMTVRLHAFGVGYTRA